MANCVFGSADHGDHQFEMRRKASFSKLSGNAVSRSMAGMYSDDKYASVIEPSKNRIFQLMSKYTPTDLTTIQRSIVNHVEYTLARTRFSFSEEDCYRAVAYSIRDRLIETLKDTSIYFFEKDFKRCYYLSLEFLTGRTMQNALVNLDIEDPYKKALSELGYTLEALYEYEHDAALGNGGLGRLAACFLDSMATCNYPCWGYGIRYTYGIFEQKIVDGYQLEHPDYWLVQDNPWEIQRQDITYAVRFYGEVKLIKDSDGRIRRHQWVGGDIVQAVAHDNPIPGFDTYNCITLRLWKATPSREFDYSSFNQGKYLDAIAERQSAECISAVLYPNDESEEGKILRLKQQYFFCCATIQDVLRRFKKRPNCDWRDLPSKITIQLNDTHPSVAIPELMRILVDVEGLEWDFAWDLTSHVFSYTNHTVLPEALETWPADLFGKLLPRHLLIINDINMQFLANVRHKMGDVWSKIAKMSIYDEGWTKVLRMANLAVIGSHKVNGVAAIHSEIMKRDLFPEFLEYYKLCNESNKFINITNGVTPRRWIHCANRPLSNLISEWLGCDEWLKDLDILRGLHSHIGENDLINEWQRVKLLNKRRLAKHIEHSTGIQLDAVNMLFDVQVKRIHEYKRQLLNCLYMIHRYLTIKNMSAEERKRIVPRATLVGGKAAPGYATAKTIIKMINCVADIVNHDPDVSEFFKIVFIANYDVSQAMIIIPAADLNQQISTAGTEASGTSNMKFVMNGSLIIGTLDGATIEIREECGDDTVFLFGAREHEVEKIRAEARQGNYPIDHRLHAVLNWIRSGPLQQQSSYNDFIGLINMLQNNCNGHNGDYYICLHDFPDYVRAQDEVDSLYRDTKRWTQLTIKAAGAMGKFSTDRTIQEYANLVWGLQVAERPPPMGQLRSVATCTTTSPSTTASVTPQVAQSPSHDKTGCDGSSRVSSMETSREVIPNENVTDPVIKVTTRSSGKIEKLISLPPQPTTTSRTSAT